MKPNKINRYTARLFILLTFITLTTFCNGDNILMVTMGGTKSHKIPFWELAKGLINRGHNITFLNGFPPDFHVEGLVEVTPTSLVNYILNYTTNWDLMGRRMNNEMPITIVEAFRYPIEACDAMLHDHETKDLLNSTFDLMIIDGAFPECALGLQYKFNIPFMYLNTVGFYMSSIARSGSPAPYSVTPVFAKAMTDDMNIFQRIINTSFHVATSILHYVLMNVLQTVLWRHLGDEIPHVYSISKNVSFILQNGHFSVSYPRPYLPNVAEIACIHCRDAQPLPKELEDFVSGGENGFVYISMGSSVKAANMPDNLRQLLINTFAKLPYRVLWKYESNLIQNDLPPNVKISRWLPQQDILGHKKLKAFVTHGGLLSMYETVYHAAPAIVMPVFCDHDVNSEKASTDGYALKLHLETLTSEKLFKAILNVIQDSKYRKAAKYRQSLLRDQKDSPLETAIYWTEYVLRHNGAYHLQSPARNMGFMQYYSLDLLCFIVGLLFLAKLFIKRCIGKTSQVHARKMKIH